MKAGGQETIPRWLVGCGVAVLILMLLVAAFSVGVFVGERGWTRQERRPLQPGAPGPNIQPPPGRRPPAPRRRTSTQAGAPDLGRMRLEADDGFGGEAGVSVPRPATWWGSYFVTDTGGTDAAIGSHLGEG